MIKLLSAQAYPPDEDGRMQAHSGAEEKTFCSTEPADGTGHQGAEPVIDNDQRAHQNLVRQHHHKGAPTKCKPPTEGGTLQSTVSGLEADWTKQLGAC